MKIRWILIIFSLALAFCAFLAFPEASLLVFGSCSFFVAVWCLRAPLSEE